jgi:hypothetical protein
MAQTYSGTSVLSQIKIGTTNYYLKDADVRTILDSFNNTICKGTVGTVSDNNSSFVTAANIKSYVDAAVAVGIVLEVVTELPTPSASTTSKIYLVKHSHQETSDTYDEYITVRSGSGTTADPYTYSFEKIGNTDIDLSAYVTNVSYTSGRALQQTKNGTTTTVHTFGALADKSSATGKLSTVDSGTVAYTPKGTLTKVTSGGTQIGGTISSITVINGNGSLPTHAADSFTANTPTAIDTTKFNAGSLPSFTRGTFSAGTLPSYTQGTFTANTPTTIDTTKFNGGSLSGGSVTFPTITSKPTATCATSGVTASVSEEVLELGTAGTATVVTSGLTLGSGTYTAPTFTAAKFLDGFYTKGTAASHASDTFSKGTLPSHAADTFSAGTLPSLEDGFYTAGTAASYAQGTFSAGSLPTTKTVTPTFTGYRYNFTGTEEAVNVTFAKTDKTVTIS